MKRNQNEKISSAFVLIPVDQFKNEVSIDRMQLATDMLHRFEMLDFQVLIKIVFQ